MACLRRAPAEGRGRAVQCDEEGCKLGYVKVDGHFRPVEKTSEADCLLQFRLRAGDPEVSGATGSDGLAGESEGVEGEARLEGITALLRANGIKEDAYYSPSVPPAYDVGVNYAKLYTIPDGEPIDFGPLFDFNEYTRLVDTRLILWRNDVLDDPRPRGAVAWGESTPIYDRLVREQRTYDAWLISAGARWYDTEGGE